MKRVVAIFFLHIRPISPRGFYFQNFKAGISGKKWAARKCHAPGHLSLDNQRTTTFKPQMKRTKITHIALQLLFLLFCLIITSCNETKRYRIGVSQCSSDVWREQMNDEMRREATFSKNIDLDFRCGHDNNALQAAQIDSLVKEGVDLLIVSPSEEVALTPAVEAAYRKGIPVILVDRRIRSDAYTAFVGADNRAIAHDAGMLIANRMKGKGTVAEFAGTLESTAGQQRHEGFTKAMADYPGINVLPPIRAGWDGLQVDREVDSLIHIHAIPDFIFAHNDRMGAKAHNAFKRHGLDIPTVGIDGLICPGGGLELVERGTLVASFIYPTGGDKAMLLAQRILQHKPFPRETKLRSAVINQISARLFRLQVDEMNERTARIDTLNKQVDRFLSRHMMQNMLLLALCIIILLIGAVLAVGVRAYFTTISHNKELAQQKRKLEEQRDQLVKLSKELEKSMQSKLAFFTEVSHDLRTPLTLIQAPVEQLATMIPPKSRESELLQIIHTNADLLLRLVGQTLDFRKFEDGRLQLNIQPTNLREEIINWCAPFRALAQKKMVRFHVESGKEDVRCFVDGQKMESVLYNLLSNAFKFTPSGGRVDVTLSTTEDERQGRCAVIRVADTGEGIAPDKIAHVFERFYQADVSHDGSGIGLATVKAYTELHGGKVSAESTQGHGTTFTVVIPLETPASVTAGMPAPLADETPSATTSPEESTATPETQTPKDETTRPTKRSAETDASKGDAAERPTVLVIDDNEDIRAYLHLLLDADYVVEEAVDGQEGLKIARKLIPDAVVCDVMMPVMDGWECCRRLKEDWQTSHIPVMLLTACALEEQRIEGFECGADAYLSKPFSPDLFRTRLRNLIANRRRLKAFFADSTQMAKADVSELDKGFTERFRALIEQRLGESDLSVEDLAADMGLGRSQLYRKVKSLTGYSPVELIRVARLKKAAELLSRTDKGVGEVAYEVGFSSPGYLTKCFREYFGVSPSDYAKK